MTMTSRVQEGVGSDGITCCWVCVPCKENEIVVDEAHCQACDLGWWPNSQQTGRCYTGKHLAFRQLS